MRTGDMEISVKTTNGIGNVIQKEALINGHNRERVGGIFTFIG
jgi:hypothetical protein